nr:AAA family ATPase [Streptomyces phaeolivaceus]
MTRDNRGRGTVITFYSFKGGTGRTMALVNTAWILASNGLRVLVVDWDLGPVWSLDQEFGRSPAREGSVLIGHQSWREAISPMSSGP